MILLDKPFVSEFLKNTVENFQIPVINTPSLNDLDVDGGVLKISCEEAIELIRSNPEQKLYTNSENSIAWISQNLTFSDIPGKINLFKNKVLFRDLVSIIFPKFYYRSVTLDNLDAIRIDMVPKPFIIKPAIGFFSMSVYQVNTNEEWEIVKEKIRTETENVKEIYPKEVMDASQFIIEQVIGGKEYAIDVYFNHQGEAVILNIMHHVFSSESDFSDRLYITSKSIILENLQPFKSFLQKIGNLSQLKNFPLHVEVRVDDVGEIAPIEVNPLRFGAWCTTADATWFAYGFNSIAAYFAGEKPDWGKLLADKSGKTYAMMVLENSTGFEARQIKQFNYEKILKDFEKPIDLRKIDYNQYPVFGFLFTETRDENFEELTRILNSDLKEYIELKD